MNIDNFLMAFGFSYSIFIFIYSIRYTDHKTKELQKEIDELKKRL